MAFRAFTHVIVPASSPVFSKPTGTVQGDIIKIYLTADNGGAGTVTWPSGFTQMDVPLDSVNDGQTCFGAWKLAGASEPSTYTPVNDQGDAMIGVCSVHSGRDTTTPIHRVKFLRTAPGGTGSWNTPAGPFGSATSIAGCDLEFFSTCDANNNGACTYTPPSGFTEQDDQTIATKESYELAVLDNQASGQTGSTNGVATQAGTTGAALTIIVALAPAPLGALRRADGGQQGPGYAAAMRAATWRRRTTVAPSIVRGFAALVAGAALAATGSMGEQFNTAQLSESTPLAAVATQGEVSGSGILTAPVLFWGGSHLWGPDLHLIACHHRKSTIPFGPQIWRGAGGIQVVTDPLAASNTRGEQFNVAQLREGIPFAASESEGELITSANLTSSPPGAMVCGRVQGGIGAAHLAPAIQRRTSLAFSPQIWRGGDTQTTTTGALAAIDIRGQSGSSATLTVGLPMAAADPRGEGAASGALSVRAQMAGNGVEGEATGTATLSVDSNTGLHTVGWTKATMAPLVAIDYALTKRI